MKRFYYILIVFPLFFAGCFKDNSNKDIREINPIVIEMFGGNQLMVKQMDTLRVEPLIYCEGVPDSELSFEWMFMSYGLTVPRLIDTTMYCCAQISEKPGDNYTLRLTVTDKTTGIFRIVTYNVKVQSSFDGGLLIADTRDGGVTSDLNLVMCREFNGSYSLENESRDIYRNIWEKVNGAPFSGKILAAQTSAGYQGITLTSVVTTEELYQASYKDYVQEWTGEQMFFVKPPFYGRGIRSAALEYQFNMKWEPMVVNGLVFQRNLQALVSKKFSYMVYPAGVADYDVSMMCIPQKGYTLYPAYGYDALGKRMLFFYNATGYKPVDQASGPFDVNNLSGYDPLFLGQTDEGVTLLVNNRISGRLQALVMNLTPGANVSGETKFAKAVFDLSGALNIGQARFYALNGQGNAVYYATQAEVYAGPLDNMGAARLQWTAKAGETITGIKMYGYGDAMVSAQVGGSHYYQDPDGNKKDQTSNGHLMLITTRNDRGEGKVTAVPVLHQHIGQLEQNAKYHVVLEGFGEILGIYKQM